jgi:hypothetical protein
MSEAPDLITGRDCVYQHERTGERIRVVKLTPQGVKYRACDAEGRFRSNDVLVLRISDLVLGPWRLDLPASDKVVQREPRN